jgi:hypothetical protein
MAIEDGKDFQFWMAAASVLGPRAVRRSGSDIDGAEVLRTVQESFP